MPRSSTTFHAHRVARRAAMSGAAGLLFVAAASATCGAAAAQPLPPPPPLPAPGPSLPLLGPLGPNGLAVLGQTGQPAAGAFGVPSIAGLDPATVLGQNAIPLAPGAGAGVPPNLNIFNNAYGIPQYLVPSAPGEGVVFDVAPGSETADVNRREWFGRWIDMYRAGQLEGGMLGQRPQEQLGQPLPGTAPPPGVNLPPGPEQFYVPPGAEPVPPPPPG